MSIGSREKVVPLLRCSPLPADTDSARSARVAPARHRSYLLSILVNSISPASSASHSLLRPLWSEEAFNRATNMCRLILVLEWRRWNGPDEIVDSRYELACTNRLAACCHALDMEDEAVVLPCMEILGDVASCLVELFRPAVPQVNLELNIAPLALPAYRRRALVLTAAELITQTLLHGFLGRREGKIAISLQQHCGHHQAVFLMEDDGCGFAPERGGAALEIVAGLTGLLEADVVYRRSKMGGTAAEIRFPASSSD